MSTLLLRLAAPLQSWGYNSRMEVRGTSREPTKSGIVGLVSSALGRSRNDPIDDISSLRFGVRVDQPGSYMTDYQTAHHPNDSRKSYVTHRAYLSDAVFLVGLEGDCQFLEELDVALRNPHYPLFLGRRSCPPSGKLSLGIREMSLEDSLTSEPWLASTWYRRRQPPEVVLEMITDSQSETTEFANDNPLSFSQDNRRFGVRGINRSVDSIKFDNPESSRYEPPTCHDAFSQLKGV